jgi:hypothetical protein
MMSGDVWDGWKLVRWPYNGRDIMESAVRAPLGGRCPHMDFICNGNRYSYPGIASLPVPKLYTSCQYMYSWVDNRHRKPRQVRK